MQHNAKATLPLILGIGFSATAGLLVSCSSNISDENDNTAVLRPQVLAPSLEQADADLAHNTLADSPIRRADTGKPALQTGAVAEESLSMQAPAVRQSLLSHSTLPVPRKERNSSHGTPRLQAEKHSSLQAADTIAGYPVDKVRAVEQDREKYQSIDDNAVVVASQQPTSTFSIDVDTGAYSNTRRFLNQGQLPPEDAVRVEELINYFSYNYAAPEAEGTPFSIQTELAQTPWNEKTHLLHVGLQGYAPQYAERPAANLVFLIDVSGSMNDKNKLGLLKSSIKMMARELDKQDSVSIVVYAGASGVVLEPTSGEKIREIEAALDRLAAGGSTNGEAGIKLAYQLAEENFKEGGINRVILATDGDFNVGTSNVNSLKELIERKRENGVALTTLGFGQGNYNDHLMEQIADTGNGTYAYIDTLNEARKVLVDELQSTLMTIAKDVKIQVEFNPAVVSEYRLIGYENRHLANEDFNNDKIDAGEIGAGHTVTALYEIALVGEGGEFNTPSRYGNVNDNKPGNQSESLVNEIAELRLRYKKPDGDKSQLISRIITRDQATDTPGENFKFSAAVASFAQYLRGGKYIGNFDLSDTVSLARSSRGEDKFGYRAEFIQLANLAESLYPARQSKKERDRSRQEG